MHGIIFFLLQRFAENTLGEDGWNDLFDEAGLPVKRYSPAAAHTDDDLFKLVDAATHMTDQSHAELLEGFGEYIGPELLALHPGLVDPEWKTLDLLANTEDVIHRVVRAKNPGAAPPQLRVQRISDREVQLVYSSERRMCSLAKGMVRGLARHFDEKIEVHEEACMLEGDPFCSIAFELKPEVIDEVPGSEDITADLPASLLPARLRGLEELGIPDQTAAAEPIEERWFGTYRGTHLLGSGGMGEVYLAEDPALRRDVAIKVLRPHEAEDEEMHARFVREARSMAALHHPNIVQVYHIGHQDQAPYIVMPHLRGTDLQRWFYGGNSVPTHELVRIAAETADALAVAHEQGLVHRDIKPGNIWLETPNGRVKVMDFGLCRDVETSGDVTEEGILIGTPVYMAPEAVDGRPEPRSDLYSLGMVMYEILTGVQPFAAETITQIIRKIATETPPPPRALAPEVPEELSNLVLRLLHKNPDRRVDSAEALAQMLREL